MSDTDKYEEVRVLADGSTTDDRWATTEELIAEVKRLREKIKTEHNLKLWEKAEVKRLRELVDNLYDFTKQMQRMGQKDPIGLEVLKDRMYWRNEE